MANQPKKYKKFVATAATATLVASAIVPVASAASFTDVSEAQAKDINPLVDLGIIKGFEDGTFKPNQAVTRGQVVKMLGKWVEAQGFAVPTDYETVQRFTDLPVTANDKELLKYAAVVADAKVFNGSNGVLNAGGKITRENMALVLNRAYEAVFGTSLVALAEGTTNVTVADLALAKEEAQPAIQAIRNLGISTVDNFNPKGDVTRANFAKFLNVAINVEGGEVTTPETGEVKIASFKASKVNQLTVEFNKAVDVDAAKFAVKRGTVEDVKVSKVEWNDAKTVATLTVDHKFADATYNLTVTGAAEEALTASVTTTKEVATEIKFNNDKLVLTGKKMLNGDALEARITFEVYNQYGEAITDKTSASYFSGLKIKGISTVDPKNGEKEIDFDSVNKGTIVVWVDKKEDEGETGTISFEYEFGDVEIDVDQDVVLSDDLEAGAVTIGKVYSVSGYDFTAKNVEKYGKNTEVNGKKVLQDEFYLLLSVKDQYGNPISAKNADKAFSTSQDASILKIVKDGLRISVSEDEIFDADEENLEVKNVDGKDYFAVRLEFEFDKTGYVKQSGENTVSIRSKAIGEVSEGKVTLADSSKVYSIGLSAPEEVVAANEKVELPVTVLDQKGNAITDAAKLNKDVSEEKIKFSGDFITLEGSNKKETPTFINKNGALFLEFTSIGNTDDKKSKDMDIEVEVTDSKQESELTLRVQPPAYAANLVKLTDKVSTSRYQGEIFDVKLSNFVVEDQYGRVIDEAKKAFTIVGEKVDNGVADFNNDSKTNTISNTDGKFTIKAGNKKGTTTFEFTLNSKDNSKDQKPVTSKLTVTFRTLDDVETFDSYKIKGESLGYFGKDGEDTVDIKVVGITSAGKEVELSPGSYQVLTNKYFKSGELVEATTDSALVTYDKQKAKIGINTKRAEDKLKADDLLNTFKTGIQVVINRTGETLTHEVSLTTVDREFATLELEDPKSIQAKDITEIKVSSSSAIDAKALFKALKDAADITVKDQYDFEHKEDAKVSVDAVQRLQDNQKFKYTISNVNSTNDTYKVVGNGSYGTAITNVESGDSFDLTIKIGTATKTVKVRVQ